MKGRIKSVIERLKNLEPKVKFTVAAFAVVAAGIAIIFGWFGSPKVHLRDSLPADSIAFFEIRDAGLLLDAMAKNTGGEPHRDFSIFKGMQVAVALTGFETSEQEITGEQSILNLKIKFAAIAETNSWSWQTQRLIDGPFNDFVTAELGSGSKRTTKPVSFGSLNVWTAVDGRRTFAFADGSRVYFGNDEAFLENCVATARGQKESASPELESIYGEKTEAMILGYFPKRAISKFAGVVGVSAAVSGSEDGGVRGFISRVVPQLVDNSLESVIWEANVGGNGIEDEITLRTTKELSDIFAQTMKTETGGKGDFVKFIPQNTAALTKYSVRDPRIAYRSLILAAAKNVDPVSGKLLNVFSLALLGSYGIRDPEAFLGGVQGEIITLELDDTERSSAAITSIKNNDIVFRSLAPDAGSSEALETGKLWETGEGYAAAVVDGILITGDKSAVEACINAEAGEGNIRKSREYEKLTKSRAASATIAEDTADYDFLFGTNKKREAPKNKFYYSETAFSKNGITRKYISRFGLFGSLVAGISGE